MPGPGFSSPNRPEKERTTVPVRGRSRARMPIVLPSLTTGRRRPGADDREERSGESRL